MNKGKFITFEGCEGVGKSWQIRFLKEYLDKSNIPCTVTREPGGSRISEKIRSVILDAENAEMSDTCEVLLYLAARAQHIKDIIQPALQDGKLVICDRYIDSTFAYQGYAKGLGASTINELNRLTVGEFLPDFTLFLDLSPDIAFTRKGGADKSDRLEQLDIAFHRRVYEGYKEIEKREPNRFIAVDASGTKFETHAKILEVLKNKGIL